MTQQKNWCPEYIKSKNRWLIEYLLQYTAPAENKDGCSVLPNKVGMST